jgi:D-alanyl-D-alanine carboxypeptidase (penicillin-binding protein 5/6)
MKPMLRMLPGLALTGLLAATLVTTLSSSAQAYTPPAPPALDNKAFILVDFNTGKVLAESNSHQHLAPASMTKMMTSYIVEQGLINGRIKETDQVLMTPDAWCHGTSAESCMYVPVNSYASVIDMLRGVIIQSGNDASKALAEHVAGNEPAFAEIMNKEAARLGMKDTHFMNATGMPDASHYSSAFDMAVLAQAIIRDSQKYYPIYAEKEFSFNNIKQGNRNALLFTDPTVDGLKTGHTDEAGYCLTASSKRGDTRLIAVVMGTRSMQERADQDRALFNWGFANFETTKLYGAGTVLSTVPVLFGKTEQVRVGLAADVALTLPRGQKDNLKVSTQLQPDLRAPLAAGQTVGQVVVTLDGQTVAQQPVVAMEAVEEAGFFQRLWMHIRYFFKRWL